MSVLTRTFARNPFDAVSMFSAVPECAFGCGAWFYADDENENGRHSFPTCYSPSDFRRKF